MPVLDKRVDQYIEKSAPFAQPILAKLRGLVHKACPEVVETWKWSFPNFLYRDKILCSMAAFKQHCSFGFWLGSMMKDPEKLLQVNSEKTAMGNFGKIESVKDLPSDKVLVSYIKEAMRLYDEDIKPPKKEKSEVKPIAVPSFFSGSLKKNKAAEESFSKMSPSHKKEYLEWITGAKTADTRERRMKQAIEWLTEGRSRNWKSNRRENPALAKRGKA